METFYRLNPAKMERYQPYMTEMLKHRKDEASMTGWVNGLYVGRAIGASIPNGTKYPDEPLRLYKTAEDEEEQLTDADRFFAFAQVFNRKFQSTEKSTE